MTLPAALAGAIWGISRLSGGVLLFQTKAEAETAATDLCNRTGDLVIVWSLSEVATPGALPARTVTYVTP